MLWWSAVLAFFGAWILALGAGYALGGAVHLLLIAGLALSAIRAWREREGPSVTPPRRDPRPPSSGGRPRAHRP